MALKNCREAKMLTSNINSRGKPEFFIPVIYTPSMWENTIPVVKQKGRELFHLLF